MNHSYIEVLNKIQKLERYLTLLEEKFHSVNRLTFQLERQLEPLSWSLGFKGTVNLVDTESENPEQLKQRVSKLGLSENDKILTCKMANSFWRVLDNGGLGIERSTPLGIEAGNVVFEMREKACAHPDAIWIAVLNSEAEICWKKQAVLF